MSLSFDPPPIDHPNDVEHRRQLALATRLLFQGRSNNTGLLTLTAGQTSTVIVDSRAGEGSCVLLSPLTANAAAAVATTYISATGKGTFTLTHANNAQTDRDFCFAVVG